MPEEETDVVIEEHDGPPPEEVEQEPEPIVPDWLDQQEEPRQESSPQQQQYYQQQQQREEARRKSLDPEVDEYVDYRARQIAEQMLRDHMGPVAYQLSQLNQRQNQFINSQAEASIQNASQAVKRGYEQVLSKDEGFRGNPRLKSEVEGTIKGMWNQAVQSARSGDLRGIAMFHDPNFFPAALAAAKVIAGYQSSASSPAKPAGADVERSRPKARKEEHDFSEISDALEAARRIGPDYVEKVKQAWLEAEEADDVKFF